MPRQRRRMADTTSEQLQQLLFDQSPVPMWVFDLDTLAFLAANEATVRTYGYTRAELLRMKVVDIRPPDEIPALLEVLGEPRSWSQETRLFMHRRRDGTVFPVEVMAHDLRFIGHRARLVMALDVSAQQHSHELLQLRARQQQMIASLGERALGGDDPDQILRDAAIMVTRMLDTDFCEILELLPMQLGADSSALILREGVGWQEGYVGCATVPSGTGSQAGFTLLQDLPVIADDLRTEARFVPPPLLIHHGVVSGMSVVIPGEGRPWGVLGVHTRRPRHFDEADATFLRSSANILAATINRRNAEAARRHMVEGMLSAQEEERRRIARELHDETGQVMTTLLVGLRSLEEAGTLEDAREGAAQLRRAGAGVLVELGRIARGLHPSTLVDLGLEAAAARLGREHAERHGVEVEIDMDGARATRLPAPVETALYRILQEVLTNSARYAAASHVVIRLRRSDRTVTLEVRDDGTGFDPHRLAHAGIEQQHLGLLGIRERAALLGGSAHVESAIGHGTTVTARIPLRDTGAVDA